MSEAPAARWNPQWTAFEVASGEYALSAGLDRTIDLRGIEAELGATLVGWSAGQTIAADTPHARTLAARLADLGAITMHHKNSLALLGDSGLCNEIAPMLRSAGYPIDADEADLAVVFRTADGWPATELTHLAVDARFHHTLVIGPYVLPGLTTCTNCVERRIARRWPQLAEPDRPASTTRPAIIAELVLIQIKMIHAGTSSLANGVISWDFETGRSEHITALMFPGCPTCDPGATDGKIELPTR